VTITCILPVDRLLVVELLPMNEGPETGRKPLAPYLLSLVRILAGLLFLQHGAEKLWGFAGGRIDHDFGTLRGFAGPLEVVGGTLIALGLFTRFTAFILCGEMAVAYFRSWAPRGFFPIQNGGEEAVLFCFIYLWLVTAGAGNWSLDYLLAKQRSPRHGTIRETIGSWHGYGLSIVRTIFAFTFCLHGFRLAFGLLPVLAGRRVGTAMALDLLPRFLGYWEIVGGVLLFLGLLSRPAAMISSVVALAAYAYGAAPRGLWPIRNGGNEALLYTLVFAYIAFGSEAAWRLDRWIRTRPRRRNEPIGKVAVTRN
jgi:putative oxidoreductase